MQTSLTIPGDLLKHAAKDAPDHPAAFASQSPSQFATLVHQHSRLLYRIALAVARNPQDAEDAVQETFLQLYRHPRWPQIDDHRSYLARIAWRTAVRKQGARKPDQELPNTLPSLNPNPETSAIDQQQQTHLHALIDQLPEKLRIPLALSALGELKLVEIAKILNLPQGTVRRRIHTGRQLLRQQWDTNRRPA